MHPSRIILYDKHGPTFTLKQVEDTYRLKRQHPWSIAQGNQQHICLALGVFLIRRLCREVSSGLFAIKRIQLLPQS